MLVYTLGSRKLEHLGRSGRAPFWLADGRRFLYLDQGKLFVLDTVTRESREVLAPPPSSTFLLASLSACAQPHPLYGLRHRRGGHRDDRSQQGRPGRFSYILSIAFRDFLVFGSSPGR